MPAVIIGAAVVGAAATVVGTVKTIDAQNKAARAQADQYSYEKQINTNKSVRERRDAIRAARMTGGQISQISENQGAGQTSAALGSQGSIQSQLDNNLSFLDTQKSLADNAGAAGQIAANARNEANTWGAVSSLGMAIFQQASSRIK